jgi:dTMP kinase
VDVGLRRKAGGRGDAWNRMEQKEMAYHQRVRAGYLDMAARDPDRWAVVDATQDVRAVWAAICDLAAARVAVRLDSELREEGRTE